MTVTTSGFWAAVVIVALGAAIVVRLSRRDPSGPTVNSVLALIGVALVAGLVALVATMPRPVGPVADHPSAGEVISALVQTVAHSSMMLGAIVGAALGWCIALAYILMSAIRAR